MSEITDERLAELIDGWQQSRDAGRESPEWDGHDSDYDRSLDDTVAAMRELQQARALLKSGSTPTGATPLTDARTSDARDWPPSGRVVSADFARQLERKCASQAREIAELKLQNSIAVAAHFQECQLSEKLHKEVFELTGRLTEAAQTVASQAERIGEQDEKIRELRFSLQGHMEHLAKADRELAAQREALESIRIFARDCIDTGHDKGALGNLYAITDLCDRLAASEKSQ